LVASAAYGWGNFQKGINSIPLFALGNYLAENFFFVWVKYLGDPKNYYSWFTGNILNPDGKFGYDGSNRLLNIWPLNMAEYALVNLAFFGGIFLILRCFKGNDSNKNDVCGRGKTAPFHVP
jgi:hypothetical protein